MGAKLPGYQPRTQPIWLYRDALRADGREPRNLVEPPLKDHRKLSVEGLNVTSMLYVMDSTRSDDQGYVGKWHHDLLDAKDLYLHYSEHMQLPLLDGGPLESCLLSTMLYGVYDQLSLPPVRTAEQERQMIHEDFIASVAFNAVLDLQSGRLSTLKDLRDYCEFSSFAVATLWLSTLKHEVLQELNPDWTAESLSGPNIRRIHFHYRHRRGPIPTRSKTLLDLCLEYTQALDWPHEDASVASALISDLLHMGGDMERFVKGIVPSKGRVFFFTQDGHIGMGPTAARADDIIAILFGGEVPYILRRTNRDGEYLLVGECYVDGIMHGEHNRKLKTDCKFEEAKTFFTLV